MYQVESARILFKGSTRARSVRLGVSGTVVLLGVTSLLADVSAEMVS